VRNLAARVTRASYMGAPNVQEYLPHPKSVVLASQFGSAMELVEYLRYLDTNQTAYDEHFVWKTDPSAQEAARQVLDRLLALSEYTDTDSFACRVCRWISQQISSALPKKYRELGLD